MLEKLLNIQQPTFRIKGCGRLTCEQEKMLYKQKHDSRNSEFDKLAYGRGKLLRPVQLAWTLIAAGIETCSRDGSGKHFKLKTNLAASPTHWISLKWLMLRQP